MDNVITISKRKSEWGVHRFQTYVRLRKGVDAISFQEKMKNYESGNQWYPKPLEKYKIIPLTQYHYSAINEKLTLKFNYLVLFSIASRHDYTLRCSTISLVYHPYAAHETGKLN